MGLCLSLAPGASAQSSGGVSVDVSPKSLTLSATKDSEVLLILHNTTTEELTDVKPRAVARGPVSVCIAGGDARTVGARSDAEWVLRIARASGEAQPVGASILVDYRQKAEGGGRAEKVASAELALALPDIETAEAPVSAQVVTDLVTIHSSSHGTLYLVLTNKTATAIEATIRVHWPESLNDAKTELSGIALAPRGVSVSKILVRANRRVTPGPQVILFDIDLSWGKGEPPQHRGLTLSQSLSVDVLVESPLLRLFGLPLILFLPGFLAVQTWSLLWGRKVLLTRYDKRDFPLTAASADFYLVAVLISFILLGLHRAFGWDYATVYGTEDLIELYVLSVVVYGLFTYLLVMTIHVLDIRRRIPATNDDWIETLRKLGRHKLDPVLPFYNRPDSAGQVYVLEPIDRDRAKTWVGPSILLTWQGDPADPKRQEAEKKILAELAGGGDAGRLAGLLARTKADKIAEIGWDPEASLGGPAEVDTTEIPQNPQRQPIVSLNLAGPGAKKGPSGRAHGRGASPTRVLLDTLSSAARRRESARPEACARGRWGRVLTTSKRIEKHAHIG